MENSKALKHLISLKTVERIAKAINKEDKSFNLKIFYSETKGIEFLELKERVNLLSQALYKANTYPIKSFLEVIKKVIHNSDLSGFELWCFSEFISCYALDEFDSSMKTMHELTQKFTAEFAIRPFLNKDFEKVLKYFDKFVYSDNEHVRRWVSEGLRPNLPWGGKIRKVYNDPTLTLKYLEILKDDESLYVRKSVANHLNDLSRINPKMVVSLLKRWNQGAKDSNKEKIRWITNHALRTLIKLGNSEALSLLGVKSNTDVKLEKFNLKNKKLKLNDSLVFSFTLKNSSKKSHKVLINYVVYFLKSNKTYGKKVFRLKSFMIESGNLIEINKSHSLKPITTMKFYSGVHKISLQINGIETKLTNFHFSV